ncbi:unnamed protein product [Notodromas monacha]|uniref:Sorting nexin-29 n=1 Tax=Notodromas monacha TaxID=399045 RepID=A0A7R9BIG6_9CRUS|nr:unnamed protein product [Notodromas monacha]CAG0914704.1 unnamed protein product [Notodromas monacha]
MIDAKHEKQHLFSSLLDAVKQCQIRFGGRQELATETDVRVSNLCARYETVLQHGFRRSITSNAPFRNVTSGLWRDPDVLVFWILVKDLLSKHECERYMCLQNIKSDVGRGRAWLRSALNERFLERSLIGLLHNEAKLEEYYEPWSLLRDEEINSMLPTTAAGLGSILFAIAIDRDDLNSMPLHMTPCGISVSADQSATDPEPVFATSLKTMAVKKSRKKKLHANHVILSDDDVEGKTVTLAVPIPCARIRTPSDTAASENSGSGFLGSSPQSFNSDYQNPCRLEDSGKFLDIISTSLPETSPIAEAGVSVASHALTPVTEPSIGELIPVFDAPSSDVDVSCTREPKEEHKRNLPDELEMDSGELRRTLFSVLSRNTDLETEVERLKQDLRVEMEKTSTLMVEIVELKRRSAEKADKAELKLSTSMRENSLLKQQLKKYVGAVQLLRNRENGFNAPDVLESLETAPSALPAIPHNQRLETRREAADYEQKLIQVAEMHGELMEFNERLQRTLRARETVIARLQEELVDLRGPLPDSLHLSEDDDASSVSDFDNSSLSAASRVLINIWIPSVFLTGGGSDTHHVYQVYLRIRDTEWNVFRRYSQFFVMHKSLCKQDPILNTFDFPPKKAIGNRDAKFVEERRRRLQHYVRCIVNFMVQNNPVLGSNPDKETLVRFLPFFKEHANMEVKKRPGRSFFRRKPERTASASQRIYTGL